MPLRIFYTLWNNEEINHHKGCNLWTNAQRNWTLCVNYVTYYIFFSPTEIFLLILLSNEKISKSYIHTHNYHIIYIAISSSVIIYMKIKGIQKYFKLHNKITFKNWKRNQYKCYDLFIFEFFWIDIDSCRIPWQKQRVLCSRTKTRSAFLPFA